MRNQEAARYARWAAFAAVAISLLVVGVYVQRAIRRSRAFRALPAMVASSIQQQSANFTYSDVEQGRTVFTIRASRATQFKDQSRALLEDVWISVYGREGNRNDNIHTRQCNYEPLSGGIRCEGDVQIDIQSADPTTNNAANPSATPASETLRVRTRDLSFNRGTGEASTSAPADFTFAQGTGHAVGINYSTSDSVIHLEHAVTFDLDASDRTGGLPVSASGSSLEIQRNQHLVVLNGPATLRQGSRELSAGKISIALDQNYRAQKLTAEQSPSIHGEEGAAKFSLLAKTFGAMLQADGAVESLVADGSVVGTRQSPAGTDRFSAAHVEVAMLPEGNLIREINATGGVAAQSQQASQQVPPKGSQQVPQQNEDSRSLKTEALRVVFAAPAAPPSDLKGATPQPANGSPAAAFPSAGAQRIESFETLAPATLESKTGNETTELGAQKLVAQFDDDGHLDKLLGHSGITLRRQTDNGTPQLSSASELVATLAAGGQWDTLDETGNVRFQQADRQATAAHATANRSTGSILLEGSPVLADSMSRTTAGRVEINQQTGDIHATGGIVSTYFAAPAGSTAGSAPVNLGSGPAHISSETLSGSTTSGHVIYSGGARLWQGDSSLNSDRIEVWRDDKKLEASGHVLAAFPQSSGLVSVPSLSNISASSVSAPKSQAAPETSGPGLWQVHAPLLTYWSDSAKAHLEGGVTAVSSQGSMQSRTLDVFLNPAKPDSPASSTNPAPGPSGPTAAIGSQIGGQVAGQATGGQIAGQAAGQLTRLLAQGHVVILQGDRGATAEQAEYTAADQKFVLSGGHPTITDPQTGTITTGASLTFFVASDTISIDSQNGLRTLTKHRVAK